jgi:hypothetical protein
MRAPVLSSMAQLIREDMARIEAIHLEISAELDGKTNQELLDMIQEVEQ